VPQGFLRLMYWNKRDDEVHLKFTSGELEMLKALAQNPHEYYQSNSEFMDFAENLFEDLKSIIDD
jgi:hypothetical protein